MELWEFIPAEDPLQEFEAFIAVYVLWQWKVVYHDESKRGTMMCLYL